MSDIEGYLLRIAELEAECDRWAEQANTTAASLRARIEELERELGAAQHALATVLSGARTKETFK